MEPNRTFFVTCNPVLTPRGVQAVYEALTRDGPKYVNITYDATVPWFECTATVSGAKSLEKYLKRLVVGMLNEGTDDFELDPKNNDILITDDNLSNWCTYRRDFLSPYHHDGDHNALAPYEKWLYPSHFGPNRPFKRIWSKIRASEHENYDKINLFFMFEPHRLQWAGSHLQALTGCWITWNYTFDLIYVGATVEGSIERLCVKLDRLYNQALRYRGPLHGLQLILPPARDKRTGHTIDVRPLHEVDLAQKTFLHRKDNYRQSNDYNHLYRWRCTLMFRLKDGPVTSVRRQTVVNPGKERQGSVNKSVQFQPLVGKTLPVQTENKSQFMLFPEPHDIPEPLAEPYYPDGLPGLISLRGLPSGGEGHVEPRAQHGADGSVLSGRTNNPSRRTGPDPFDHVSVLGGLLSARESILASHPRNGLPQHSDRLIDFSVMGSEVPHATNTATEQNPYSTLSFFELQGGMNNQLSIGGNSPQTNRNHGPSLLIEHELEGPPRRETVGQNSPGVDLLGSELSFPTNRPMSTNPRVRTPSPPPRYFRTANQRASAPGRPGNSQQHSNLRNLGSQGNEPRRPAPQPAGPRGPRNQGTPDRPYATVAAGSGHSPAPSGSHRAAPTAASGPGARYQTPPTLRTNVYTARPTCSSVSSGQGGASLSKSEEAARYRQMESNWAEGNVKRLSMDPQLIRRLDPDQGKKYWELSVQKEDWLHDALDEKLKCMTELARRHSGEASLRINFCRLTLANVNADAVNRDSDKDAALAFQPYAMLCRLHSFPLTDVKVSYILSPHDEDANRIAKLHSDPEKKAKWQRLGEDTTSSYRILCQDVKTKAEFFIHLDAQTLKYTFEDVHSKVRRGHKDSYRHIYIHAPSHAWDLEVVLKLANTQYFKDTYGETVDKIVQSLSVGADVSVKNPVFSFEYPNDANFRVTAIDVRTTVRYHNPATGNATSYDPRTSVPKHKATTYLDITFNKATVMEKNKEKSTDHVALVEACSASHRAESGMLNGWFEASMTTPRLEKMFAENRDKVELGDLASWDGLVDMIRDKQRDRVRLFYDLFVPALSMCRQMDDVGWANNNQRCPEDLKNRPKIVRKPLDPTEEPGFW